MKRMPPDRVILHRRQAEVMSMGLWTLSVLLCYLEDVRPNAIVEIEGEWLELVPHLEDICRQIRECGLGVVMDEFSKP